MPTVSFPRSARKVAVVCLAFALAVAFAIALSGRAAARAEPATRARAAVAARTHADATARAKYPSVPLSIAGADDARVLAYPPRDPSRSLTVVYLHGVHGRAENGCPWLRAGASELGWLVCPEANVPEAPGFSWAGSASDKRAIVARAERAAQAQGAAPGAPSVLVGFSQGAYVAVELLQASLGRYRGVVLLAAEVEPRAADLAQAGVTRVALGAGDLDPSSRVLARAAERLRAEGIEARYVSLGRVGHTYVAEEPAVLSRAIAWAGGRDDAS